MQFARDTRPLVDALFETNVEPLRQLIKAEPIEAPQKYQERGDAGRAEPSGLIVSGSDSEIQRRTGLIPYAAVIAGNHMELVLPRPKLCVIRLPACADVLPIVINAIEPIAEEHALGVVKAESGVVNL